MEYTSETIQKAIDKKGWSGKQKTDELLKIYKMIKEIDEELGKTLLTAMDS